MDFGFSGKKALVTGASKGIGYAVAEGLAQQGCELYIVSRNEQELQQIAQQLKDNYQVPVFALAGDVSTAAGVAQVMGALQALTPTLDILILNTGGPPAAKVLEHSDELWLAQTENLLMSVIRFCRSVVPMMSTSDAARIVLITSYAAKSPSSLMGISNTLRAGLMGLTKTLSNELAEHNILVNAVLPGLTQTQRMQSLSQQKGAQLGQPADHVLQEWTCEIPLGRLAHPQEIANAVIFLASRAASYITGVSLSVDGGLNKSIL